MHGSSVAVCMHSQHSVDPLLQQLLAALVDITMPAYKVHSWPHASVVLSCVSFIGLVCSWLDSVCSPCSVITRFSWWDGRAFALCR